MAARRSSLVDLRALRDAVHVDPAAFDRRRQSRRRTPRRRSDAAALAATPAALLALGFVGGLALGLTAWGGVMHGNRRGLFSRHPVRRFAAISWLASRPSAETARLLSDYVRWEPQPLLRRRGRAALAAVLEALDG